MFGIDSSELAIIALVALLVIGPKDLPRVMRSVGQWMAKGRAMTRHVRAGFDTMMRESELAEMQAQWAAQNEAIMKATALPDLSMTGPLATIAAEPAASDQSATEDWQVPAPPLAPEPQRASLAPDAPETPAPKPRRGRAKPAASKPARARPAATLPPVAASAPPAPRKRAARPKAASGTATES